MRIQSMNMNNITKIPLYSGLKPVHGGEICGQNEIKGFVAMAVDCYDNHRPLYIDPKVIWITIVYQVYLLITLNSEKLRNKYVNFQGKKDIEIVRSDFDLDSVALEFADRIDDIILDKDFKNWIRTKFSTSDEKDEVTLSIMMMGVFKNYFSYFSTACGIPEINILGTLQDWKLLKQNLAKILDFEILTEYGIRKWHDDLNDLIDNFISAKNKTIDESYWKNFIKGYYPGGSGGKPYVEGHVVVLQRFFETGGELKERGEHLYLNELASEYTICELKINDVPYELKSGNMNCVELEDEGFMMNPGYTLTMKTEPEESNSFSDYD